MSDEPVWPPPTMAKWLQHETIDPAKLADELEYWLFRLRGSTNAPSCPNCGWELGK